MDKLKCAQHPSFPTDVVKIAFLFLYLSNGMAQICFLTLSLWELMWNFSSVMISTPFQTSFALLSALYQQKQPWIFYYFAQNLYQAEGSMTAKFIALVSLEGFLETHSEHPSDEYNRT